MPFLTASVFKAQNFSTVEAARRFVRERCFSGTDFTVLPSGLKGDGFAVFIHAVEIDGETHLAGFVRKEGLI